MRIPTYTARTQRTNDMPGKRFNVRKSAEPFVRAELAEERRDVASRRLTQETEAESDMTVNDRRNRIKSTRKTTGKLRDQASRWRNHLRPLTTQIRHS